MLRISEPGPFDSLISLTIKRRLPGPVERVWAYLTDSELRSRWLASGVMELKVNAPFELVWRNNELTNPPGKAPDWFTGEHRMQGHIVVVDPPHRLVFTWAGSGNVSIELVAQGEAVLLTLTHHRLPDRDTMRGVSAGWHAHLDLLVARVAGSAPIAPHWDHWTQLREDYDKRLPA